MRVEIVPFGRSDDGLKMRKEGAQELKFIRILRSRGCDGKRLESVVQ